MSNRKSAKSNKEDFIDRQANSKEYREGNILFKINSHHGQDEFNGKKFPAKFSINITNDTKNQISESRHQGRDTARSRKNVSPSQSPEIFSPDNQRYQSELQKRQADYETLRAEANEEIHKYSVYVEELENQLHTKHREFQKTRQEIEEREKNERALSYKLKRSEQRLERIANEKKDLMKRMNQLPSHEICEEKVRELEAVIQEKEETIKKISKMNNEVYQRMMSGQQKESDCEVKNMQKWLKKMNKVFNTGRSENSEGTGKSGNVDAQFLNIVRKYEQMQGRAHQLNRINMQLQNYCRELSQQNHSLQQTIAALKEELKISDNMYSQQKQKREQLTQETFYKRSISASLSQTSPHESASDGTVKVKMEILLLEKDKRIGQLENELQEARRESILLRTKMMKDEEDKDFVHEAFRKTFQSQDNMRESILGRSKSVDNFRGQKKSFKMASVASEEEECSSDVQRLCTSIKNQYKNFSNTLNQYIEKTQSIAGDSCRPTIAQKQRRTKHRTPVFIENYENENNDDEWEMERNYQRRTGQPRSYVHAYDEDKSQQGNLDEGQFHLSFRDAKRGKMGKKEGKAPFLWSDRFTSC